jgi:hypothetical protein
MSSSIPGAVTYFMDLCNTALPDPVSVQFTSVVPMYTSAKMLIVKSITDIVQTPAELGPSYKREEEYRINCELTSYYGDQNVQSFSDRFDEVFSMFSQITVALGNDYMLGGNVRLAQVEEGEYTPKVDLRGRTVGCLDFTIHCEQRIESLT